MRRMSLMQAMPEFTTPAQLHASMQYGKANNGCGALLHMAAILDGLPKMIPKK